MFKFLDNYYTEKQKHKNLKLQRSVDLEQRNHEIRLKKLELEEKYIAQGKILPDKLDQMSMEQMEKSWKDEIIMIVLFLPVVLVFIPGIQTVAGAGFVILKTVPQWYVYMLIGIVTVTYGLRSLVKLAITKKPKNQQINVIEALPQVPHYSEPINSPMEDDLIEQFDVIEEEDVFPETSGSKCENEDDHK